jgi:hypothetical protein
VSKKRSDVGFESKTNKEVKKHHDIPKCHSRWEKKRKKRTPYAKVNNP